jgi:hydrogenase maturation protease
MTRTVDHGKRSRQILVVGLGNPDRGDDGLGAIVARNLVGRLPSDVSIMERAGDMLSLISDWAGFDALVCVDAATPMTGPGRIHRIDLMTDYLPRNISMTSSHALGLFDAIELGRTLRLAPRNIIIYAVEGRCFEDGAPLTPEVAAAAGEAADRIVAEVDRLRQDWREISPHA